MRYIILKALIVITIIFSKATFGQTKTENKKGTQGLATGGYKPNIQETPPNNNSVNYESRSYQNDCYKNFAFTVKNYGYNKDGNFYSWGVVVKNNYSKAVQLKYKLIVGNNNSHIGTLTYYIKPGETYSNDFGKAKAIIVNNNSDQYKIEVSDVCFEGDDCVKNGYAGCNGKQSATAGDESNKNQKSNSREKPQNGIQESIHTHEGVEYKYVNEYKDGKIIKQKNYNNGILQDYSLFDSNGNRIEMTGYYSSGEKSYYRICEKNGLCNTKFFNKNGSIVKENNEAYSGWKY